MQEPAIGAGTWVCADPASRALAKLVARVAPSDVPVVISGDAGTGKGALARRIHAISGRTGAFVCVNCGALGARRIGGESGASTASSCSEDWFEAAKQGTLFLDEVAALPADLQAQLLRTLQDREVQRTNTADPADQGPADVRLIVSTTVDLSEAISAGHFRLDLFYRLNVGKVRLLPLRQRRGDVASLAAHFLSIHAARLNLVPPPSLSPQTLSALSQYPWPGNIRELENAIRFALLVAPERELRPEHLKLEDASSALRAAGTEQPVEVRPTSEQDALRQWLIPMLHVPGRQLLTDVESQIVAEAFRFTGRNQVQTAALLGISRNVLRTLLRKHGLFAVRRRVGRSDAREGI